MVAKVAGGILGIGLIGTGGVAVTKPWWLGMDYMPEWLSLSEDNGVSTTTYETDKFANKHTKYLVGVTNKENKFWWEWAYRRLQEDDVKEGAFTLNTKVNSGFKEGNGEENKPKALNQVCNDAYKATSTSVKANGKNSGEFNEEHVWKYCSPFGGKLKTVKDVDNKDAAKKYDTEKIGGKKESELISATGSENDKFWEIREKEFKDLSKDDQDSYFAKNKKGKTIKELCEYVYGQTTKTEADDNGKIEEATAVKYCALSSS